MIIIKDKQVAFGARTRRSPWALTPGVALIALITHRHQSSPETQPFSFHLSKDKILKKQKVENNIQ